MLVITGNPRIKDGKTEVRQCFSAGWDLSETAKVERICEIIAVYKKPVIAMVKGFALGGGCEIALACDFIFAAEEAEMGLPEIKRGLLPGWGGTQRLPRRVGVSRAKKIMFTGEHVSGKKPRKSKPTSVPLDKLEETVMALPKAIEQAPLGLQKIKEVINKGIDTDLQTGYRPGTGGISFPVSN